MGDTQHSGDAAGGAGPGGERAPGARRLGTGARRRRSRGLSALLQRSILAGAAVAMLLFGAPLAVATRGLYRSEAYADLAGDAERAHAAMTSALLNEQGMVNLPRSHTEHGRLAAYDADGDRIGGVGPARAEALVLAALRTGLEDQAVIGDQIVVAVPVTWPERDRTYVVRAAAPYSEVLERTYATWAVMAGLGAAVLAVVAALGRAHARRIARPLQSLASVADALGHGDFSVRAVHAGITEVDAVSHNLERTALRLGGMLERERSFSADASHQLRTPLTALRIGLESALLTPGTDLRATVEEALTGLDRLEQTVLDLLALARDTSGPRQATEVPVLLHAVVRPWIRALEEQERVLHLDLEPDLPRAAVSQPALRTVLDVLLGNALTHGRGEVWLQVRGTEDTVMIEVRDEGPGVAGDPARIFARRSAEARGTGIGLALARSLVEADGGRLELTRAVPATFALFLPAIETAPDAGQPVVGRGAARAAS